MKIRLEEAEAIAESKEEAVKITESKLRSGTRFNES